MEFIKVIILGIIQGVSEFLPISSSGHLVLFKQLMNVEAGLVLDTFLHFGTLIAVIFVFREDVKNMIMFKGEYKKYNLYIIIGSIPAAFVGFLFEDFFEGINSNVTLVGFMLIVTAIILYLSDKISSKDYDISDMNYKDSIFIGLAQAFAIFPGISRSGSTIVGGLIRGLDRKFAARFSFLLSIPVITGATLLQVKRLTEVTITGINYPELIAGMVASIITGYFSIKLLMKLINMKKLKYFAYYCFSLGLILIFVLQVF
ncbi:MAG: undecaprenyl-diphosphate phosphatase [Bacillota bacterium]